MAQFIQWAESGENSLEIPLFFAFKAGRSVFMRRMNQHRPQLIPTQVESTLEMVITERIAKDLGIRPEEITPQFIHEWREKNLYRKAPVNITNRIGGFNAHGKRVLTGEQIDLLCKSSEAFLGQFL